LVQQTISHRGEVQMNRSTPPPDIPEAAALSREVAHRLECYLAPLLVQLDQRMDVRLVRTFAATLVNLVRHRDRTLSLLLTELGELLTDGAHAPAGVKRLWRLLRSARWEASLISEVIAADADRAVARALAQDGCAYAVLDGSVLEKPAAHAWPGLTKVRSAVAVRLRRSLGGPPSKPPVIVSGLAWLAVVVTGRTGSLTLGRMDWYSPTAPGDAAQTQGEAERSVIRSFLRRWHRRVIWVADRAYGNHPFVGEVLLPAAARFIVRWRRDYELMDPLGEISPASQLTRRMRSRWKVMVVDPRRPTTFTLGLASLPVYLPGTAVPLWLIVARRRDKKHPLWLLTTEPADTEAAARAVVTGYVRRWQVEWAFRFQKADLGVASVRVASWLYREKLLRLAELVHAFLLQLLATSPREDLDRILRWCHRTGQHARTVEAPLYRLRHALANLWNLNLPTLAWTP
jgi:hypothetical protein